MEFPCPSPQAVTVQCTESGAAGDYLGPGDPVRVLACGMDESCIRGDEYFPRCVYLAPDDG